MATQETTTSERVARADSAAVSSAGQNLPDPPAVRIEGLLLPPADGPPGTLPARSGLSVHFSVAETLATRGSPETTEVQERSAATADPPRSIRALIEQVERNPESLAEVPEALRVESVCLAAIGNDPRCIREVPQELLENKHFLLRSLAANPRAYHFFEAKDQQDPVLALEALSQDAWLATRIPDELLSDFDFIQSAVEANPAVFEALPESLRRNPKLILAAVTKDANSINHVPLESLEQNPELIEQIALSNLLAERTLKARLQTLAPEVTANFDRLREAYWILDIDRLGPDVMRHGKTRGVFDNSREVIRNRYLVSDADTRTRLEEALGKNYFAGLATDRRPLALVIYPRSDHNGAFQQGGYEQWRGGRNAVDALTNEFRVVYFQAGTDTDVFAAIKQTSERSGTPISTLLLAGHGQAHSIELSEHGELNGQRLDELSKLRDSFKPDAQVLLFSCSTSKLLSDQNEILSPIAVGLNTQLEHVYVAAPTDPVVPYLWVSPATKVPRMQGHDLHSKPVSFASHPPIDAYFSNEKVELNFNRYTDKEAIEKIRASVPPELYVVKHTPTSVVLRQYAHGVAVIPKEPGWELKVLENMLEISIGATLTKEQFADIPSRWTAQRGQDGYLSDEEIETFKSALKADLGYDGPIRIRFEVKSGYATLHVLRADEKPLCRLTFLTDPQTGKISETVSNKLCTENF